MIVRARDSRRGADTVIDVAGGNSIKSSIKSTRVGGRAHMVGYAAGTSTDIDIFEAIRHAVTINVGMAGHRASFEAMIRAIEVNKICPTRGAIYKASEFRLALARLAQGGHLGKIVLELGDGLWCWIDDIPLAGPTRRCRGENFWIASEKNPPPQGDQNCGPKPPDKWAS